MNMTGACMAESSVIVIEERQLAELLPHRGKMLLINRVINYDIKKGTLCSEYKVTKDCLFYDPVLGGLPAWMSFEFMAQSVSAFSGISGRIYGKPPMIGFILSVSSFEIKKQIIKAGELLRITIVEESRVGMVSTFFCTVFSSGPDAFERSGGVPPVERTGESEVSGARLMVMDVDNYLEFTEKGYYGK